MKLTYRGHIPEKDLLGRVLGPDMFGAWTHVVGVEHTDINTTIADCLPVPPAQAPNMTKDQWGQHWLPLPDRQEATQ